MIWWFGKGHERVVVLRYGFWKRYFGADPGAIGKAIMLNGNSYTIVGVIRLEFRFSNEDPGLWAPFLFESQWRENRSFTPLDVIARLKRGVLHPRPPGDQGRSTGGS